MKVAGIEIKEPDDKVLKQLLHVGKLVEQADGCAVCLFNDREEWELPCSRCRRNCKDYWRPKEEK